MADFDTTIEEIESLNYNLNALTRTVIEAENSLAKAIGVETKAVKENTQAVQQNTQTTGQNTNAKKLEFEEIRRLVYLRTKERDETNRYIDEIGRSYSTTQVLRNEFEKTGVGAKVLSASLEGLFKSISTYASAIYKGERGQLAAAKAATAATKPIIELGEAVGTVLTVMSLFLPGLRLLGVGIFALSKGLGLVNDLNEKAAEQTDKLFKSFNELSRAGVGMQGGFDGMFKTLQQMGYSVSEIEEFNKVIGSSVDKLSLIGPTAAGGLRQFAEVSGQVVKQYGRELEMMGINRDEQRQSALAYMALQSRTGQLQFKNTQQLAVESAKFAKELDLMAQLTGTSREAQQKAIDANMADARFRSAQREAEMRQDQAEIRRLAKAEQLARMLRSAGLTEEASGVLQFAAGGMSTPAAIKSAMQFGLQEALSDPNTSVAQLLQKSLNYSQEQIDKLVGVTKYTGSIDVIQGDIAKLMDMQIRMREIEAAAAEKGMTLDKFMQTEQGMRMLGDKQLQGYVDATRNQQNIAMSLDGAVRAFAQTGNTFKSATGMFAEAVRAMPGAKPFGGGYAGAGAAAGPTVGPSAVMPGRAATKMPAAPGAAPTMAGLRIKGAESTAGGGASPRLVALAQQIQSALGGELTYFSAFNDSYHQGTNSKHSQGLALDFTVRSPKDSAGYVNLVQDVMSKSGIAGKVLNEYVNPSRSATGGHIHVEIDQFKDGGIATGPKSGYPATLHGTEAVIPMGDGRSIPINMPGVVEELRELVSLSRRQVSASEKLLQYSQG